MVTLRVSFPFDIKTFDVIEARICKAIGRKYSDDSGCGFGTRDVGFEFKDNRQAKSAMDKIQALRIPKLTIDVD